MQIGQSLSSTEIRCLGSDSQGVNMVTRKLVETALNFSFGFKSQHEALGQFNVSLSKILAFFCVRNDYFRLFLMSF